MRVNDIRSTEHTLDETSDISLREVLRDMNHVDPVTQNNPYRRDKELQEDEQRFRFQERVSLQSSADQVQIRMVSIEFRRIGILLSQYPHGSGLTAVVDVVQPDDAAPDFRQVAIRDDQDTLRLAHRSLNRATVFPENQFES